MNRDYFISQYGKQLNSQQLEAVESVEGPVLLLAVPGSGKTTVLVTRVGYMILCRNIPAENILVLTYTIAATKDMGQRFESIFGGELAGDVEFRTINGICAKVIQKYAAAIGKEPFELLTEEKETNRIVNDILVDILPEYPTESDVRTARTWITYCKNMMLENDEIMEIGEREDLPLLEIFERYNQVLRSNRLMDYDDQMIYAYEMLLRDFSLLEYYRNRFRYICVDEAQDTSRIQHEIIALLAGVNGNLFMVGDEDQSIYGFRAAYPEALLNFEKTHSKAKVLVMNLNYRSNATIVRMADRFIQSNEFRHKKNMQAVRGAGSDVRFVELKSRGNQYNYLLKVAQDCTHETAVLYRLNESCLPLVDLLERNHIPFRIKGMEMTFFSHRVVQDVCNMMRFARDPYNTDLFMKVYYKFQSFLRRNQAEAMCAVAEGRVPVTFGPKVTGTFSGKVTGTQGPKVTGTFSEGTQAAASGRRIPVLEAAEYVPGISGMVKGKCRAAATHFAKMRNETPDKAIYRIVNYMGYGEYMERNGMDRNKIFLLMNLAYREKTLESFEKRLGYLYGMLKNIRPDYNAKFILSTIHSSKGLEYDEVYLMDACDGVFPADVSLLTEPGSKREKKDGEEERRLCYVAMTRAKERLNIITYASEESVFAGEVKRCSGDGAEAGGSGAGGGAAGGRVTGTLGAKVTGTQRPKVTGTFSGKVTGTQAGAPAREPKCGDIVYQVAYGRGQIIEVGLNKNGSVKDFTVWFDSGKERDFIYPTAFIKGMYYLEEGAEAGMTAEEVAATEAAVAKVPAEKRGHALEEEEFLTAINSKYGSAEPARECPENTPLVKPVKEPVAEAKKLFEKLRELRLKLAKDEKQPAFCVFPDKVLIRMAEVQPVTKWQMLEISGIGEAKFAKYGEQFLQVIRDFKGENFSEGSAGGTPEKREAIAPVVRRSDGTKEIYVKPVAPAKAEGTAGAGIQNGERGAGAGISNGERAAGAGGATGSTEKKMPAKPKIETYTLDGETYRLIRGNWVNSQNTRVTKDEMYRLNAIRMKKIDFAETDVETLINLAQEMKDSDDLIFSKKLFEEILERSGDRLVVQSILPRYTSILRKEGRPREAIEVAEKYFSLYGKSVSSPTLYTSLAGAYCDIGDPTEARKKANIAMAMCGGNAGVELQSVYKRIGSME
ncbi:MAG: UvrD-helicase domain-containing protein [Lachnospiraceae bacterium]|nr:UvrD-helicase domain-containing protein [Lachnospiraceae bacterium]